MIPPASVQVRHCCWRHPVAPCAVTWSPWCWHLVVTGWKCSSLHLPLHGKGFRPASVSPAILGSQIPILTTIPTAAEKHWEWQPCLLPCCHCNTRDSSHSTGAALLRAWSSESSIPGQAALGLGCVWGHCCPLSLLPGIKAGTALSQQLSGHTAICPCGLYLEQNRLISHPFFSRESP